MHETLHQRCWGRLGGIRLMLVVVWLKTDEKCSHQALDGGIDVTVSFQGWRLHNSSRELKIFVAPGRNGALVIGVASPSGQVGSRSRVAPASIPVCAFHGRQARRQEARRPRRPPEECTGFLPIGNRQKHALTACIHVSLEWLLVMPEYSFLAHGHPRRSQQAKKVVSPACSQEAVISQLLAAAAQPKPVT